MIQNRPRLLRALLSFAAAFLVVLLFRMPIRSQTAIRDLAEAFVIALCITLALLWFERPRPS